jgi:hypothetical protein
MTNNVYAGVAPIVPPELRGVTQAARVTFRDELSAYRMMHQTMKRPNVVHRRQQSRLYH